MYGVHSDNVSPRGRVLSSLGSSHPSEALSPCGTFAKLELQTLIVLFFCLLELHLSVFKKDLDKDVHDDTSGIFRKLLLALLQVRMVSGHSQYLYSDNFKTETDVTRGSHPSAQTKRDEPSSVVDFEKIDQDARVSTVFVIVCA